MVLFRVITGILWVSILLIGRAILTPGDPVPRVSISFERGASLPGDPPRSLDAPGAGPATRLDLYGNPVESAVGDYRADPGGTLYERHAPDTALLDLAPAGV